ncbi:hypothetical protein SscP1EGY_29 [Streptomyces phage SscP1EGY]|nr:hypothetical protein SscP1EGY_29 [Streptomyces phage SscP1EGY]
MKKFLLYTAGGTTIFIAGAVTATVVVGRMVLPVVDANKVSDKIMERYEKTQRSIERKVFGKEFVHPPMLDVGSRHPNPR